jgi:hypothetical protein
MSASNFSISEADGRVSTSYSRLAASQIGRKQKDGKLARPTNQPRCLPDTLHP